MLHGSHEANDRQEEGRRKGGKEAEGEGGNKGRRKGGTEEEREGGRKDFEREVKTSP